MFLQKFHDLEFEQFVLALRTDGVFSSVLMVEP